MCFLLLKKLQSYEQDLFNKLTFVLSHFTIFCTMNLMFSTMSITHESPFKAGIVYLGHLGASCKYKIDISP